MAWLLLLIVAAFSPRQASALPSFVIFEFSADPLDPMGGRGLGWFNFGAGFPNDDYSDRPFLGDPVQLYFPWQGMQWDQTSTYSIYQRYADPGDAFARLQSWEVRNLADSDYSIDVWPKGNGYDGEALAYFRYTNPTGTYFVAGTWYVSETPPDIDLPEPGAPWLMGIALFVFGMQRRKRDSEAQVPGPLFRKPR